MNNSVDRSAYLDYAKNFTEKEKSLIRQFVEWLPRNIIDCHAHCNLEEHVLFIGEKSFNHMLSTFPSFSIEESYEWHNLLHPGIDIRALRFPKTFRGIDHKNANLYLLEQSDARDRVALFGLPEDIDYTVSMLSHPRVSALKMYYSYVEPQATEVYQYFPQEVLEEAQSRDIPIILHPPVKITSCLNQLLQLYKDFPRLRVCMAHLGLTKQVIPGLEQAFNVIAGYPQVSFDTALVPSAEVVAMALRVVGEDRIMYGSDQPLHLIRSTAYIHPTKGERLVTEYPYHWVNLEEHLEFKHFAVGVTHAHWQSLLAIKTSLELLPLSFQDGFKDKIFFANAKFFYGF